jgi:antitoxin (DNA-binding transcriptional repressor) of toxin-antitoxin stability system
MRVMNEIIPLHIATSTLAQLVKRAASGERVYIGAHGRAEAKLVAVDATERPPRVFGFMRGKLELPTDLEAPLPLDVVRSFEGDE